MFKRDDAAPRRGGHADARRLFAARGAVVLSAGVPPPALYVVIHGAVEVSVRGPETVAAAAAGGTRPGGADTSACSGHRPRSPRRAPASGRCCSSCRGRASRRCWTARPMPARAFVLAFSEDVVRALRYAESPVAALRVSAGRDDDQPNTRLMVTPTV